MTNNEHTIIVPNDLLKNWEDRFHDENENVDVLLIEAYEAGHRAGADQELEACEKWLKANEWIHSEFSDDLRAARRPQPTSLKQQALAALQREEEQWPAKNGCRAKDRYTIRRALESLPD